MSIHLNTLQNPQQHHSNATLDQPIRIRSKVKLRLKNKIIMLCVLAGISMIALQIALHSFLVPSSQPIMAEPNTQSQLQSQLHPIPLPKLILNGIFISGNEKIAMINQAMYSEGETINDFEIVAIKADSVSLRNKDNMLLLKMH